MEPMDLSKSQASSDSHSQSVSSHPYVPSQSDGARDPCLYPEDEAASFALLEQGSGQATFGGILSTGTHFGGQHQAAARPMYIDADASSSTREEGTVKPMKNMSSQLVASATREEYSREELPVHPLSLPEKSTGKGVEGMDMNRFRRDTPDLMTGIPGKAFIDDSSLATSDIVSVSIASSMSSSASDGKLSTLELAQKNETAILSVSMDNQLETADGVEDNLVSRDALDFPGDDSLVLNEGLIQEDVTQTSMGEKDLDMLEDATGDGLPSTDSAGVLLEGDQCTQDSLTDKGAKKPKSLNGNDAGPAVPVCGAEQLFEYQWPPEPNGDFYMLQEQVSEYLGVVSFKRKYPDLIRRPIDFKERVLLRDRLVVTETQCDLGLTPLKSDEVCELMSRDYPEKYKEYLKVLHDREREKIRAQNREFELSNLDKNKMALLLKKAVRSAAEYNAQFMREKREERRAYFDLQTQEVHYPRSKFKVLPPEQTKVGAYPLALVPGQFQEHFRSYMPQELNYFPVNTALYTAPRQIHNMYADPKAVEEKETEDENDSSGSSDGSDSDSSDSDGDSVDGDTSLARPLPETPRRTPATGVPRDPADLAYSHSLPQGLPRPSTGKKMGKPRLLDYVGESGRDSGRDSDSASQKSVGGRTPKVKGTPKAARKGRAMSHMGIKAVTVDLTRIAVTCNICNGAKEGAKEPKLEELVKCSVCSTHGHPSCLELTEEMIPIIKTYPWQCMECKTCVKCKEPHDEDKMMFCDHCDRGYHSYCVKLDCIPPGRWVCLSCQPDDLSPRKKLKQR